MTVLVIDNYDSFVHNLARYCRVLRARTRVIRNDEITVEQVKELSPTHIILSPGPCTPNEAGVCLDIVAKLANTIPILGVCLGHQAIAQAFGGMVVPSGQPMHGKASAINHNEQGIFADIPKPLQVGRYHSLIVVDEKFPKDLKVTARTEDGTIMAVEHRHWPVWGVQFHPESVLTDYGQKMIENFLQQRGFSL